MEVGIMGIEKGKVVLITGSGTGLGRAAAVAFAKEGSLVVLNGRRADKLQLIQKEILDLGGDAFSVQADVSTKDGVSKLVQEAILHYGSLDIVINNAATFEANPMADTSLEAWNRQLATNVTGPFLMMKETIPILRQQGSGCIINITSALAANGAGGYAAYSASKAALESLTRTAAEEERVHKLGIFLYDPGTVRSEMHATGRDPHSVAPDLLKLAEHYFS
jgi:3-oxoacyl-[acyl-carrier protein] reductase